jgi:UDP-N-acetylglucosamine--dolichyl-phosphate N-acetylglucosaminephosphotransferase
MATTPQLTRTETVSLVALSAACGTVLANTFRGEGEPLVASLALSGMAYAAAYAMIRWLGPTFIKAGLKGADMSKANKRELPECAGAICAVVYLLAIIVFTPFPFYKDIVAATSGGGNRDVVLHAEHVHEGRFLHKFPHSKVTTLPDQPLADQAPSDPLTLSHSSHPSFPPYCRYRP